MARFRVYFRFDFELPPCSHQRDIPHALNKVDAEGVVKYMEAKNGRHVVIIKSFKIDNEFFAKRHTATATPRRFRTGRED